MSNNFLRGNSYYIVMVIISLILIAITILLHINKAFYLVYTVNSSSINTAFMTVFGIFFAFVFTILAILFSLKEDSYFFTLVHKHNRNKKDIINYFTLTISFLFLVFLVSLFLTITYVNNNSSVSSQVAVILKGINGFTQILIPALVYLSEIAFVNLILLTITFVGIIRS